MVFFSFPPPPKEGLGIRDAMKLLFLCSNVFDDEDSFLGLGLSCFCSFFCPPPINGRRLFFLLLFSEWASLLGDAGVDEGAAFEALDALRDCLLPGFFSLRGVTTLTR